jgi:hypothetical protein
MQNPGKIAARMREACDEARTDPIGNVGKNNRNRSGLVLESGRDHGRLRHDHFGMQGDQFLSERSISLRFTRGKTVINVNVAAFRPASLGEPRPQRDQAGFHFWIIFGVSHQHADVPCPL